MEGRGSIGGVGGSAGVAVRQGAARVGGAGGPHAE